MKSPCLALGSYDRCTYQGAWRAAQDQHPDLDSMEHLDSTYDMQRQQNVVIQKVNR